MTKLFTFPRQIVQALVLAGLGFTAHPAIADSPGQIQPRDITRAIVPTVQTTRGADRDFNGPALIVIGVQLSVGRGGRAVFAEVLLSAREQGGDGTATNIRMPPTEVWRWHPEDGPRFVREITSQRLSLVRFTSGSGSGCAPLGCAIVGPSEDGGQIVTVRGPLTGPVRDVTVLGDTLGDDISTDSNPHGDVSVRRIRFNRVNVIFTDELVRR